MSSETPRQPAAPFAVERLMRHASLHGDAVYGSEDEFLAAVGEKEGAELADRRRGDLAHNPGEMAQELAFQAYETEDDEAARDLVEKALALDPGNCDALTVHAYLNSDDAGELISSLERAAESGAGQLGDRYFAELTGDFWSLVRARPYMRTLKQLAEVQWTVGRRFDSVEHYEYLLDMDPEDRMGNGMLLLGNYLAMGEIQRAWDLLADIDDQGTICAWAWVLLHVMVDEDAEAREALHHAMDANPYVAPWFVNMGDPEAGPVTSPTLQPGSEDEALVCADLLGEGWLRSPDAQWWLHDVLVELGLLEDEEGRPNAPTPGPAN